MKQAIIYIIIIAAYLPSFAQIQRLPARSKFIKEVSFGAHNSIVDVQQHINWVTTDKYKVKAYELYLEPQLQLEQTKALCPLLHADPSVLLKGDLLEAQTAQLNWKATNAYFAHHYALERSVADTFHFEQVAMLWPEELSQRKECYEKNDLIANEGRYFYRVKLALLNGNTVYSNIEEVSPVKEVSVSVFPNPANKFIMLQALNDGQQAQRILMVDGGGKAVLQRAVQRVTAERFSIEHLAPGQYWIRLEMADRSIRTATFIKQ